MALSVNTNIASIQAQRSLGGVTKELSTSFRRLSTGLRITSAADDAAGLAISERLRGQIRSLDQAKRNANDGISMVQTAEGALGETSNLLLRLRELGVQAGNGTVSDADRDTLQQEFGELVSEIDRIAQSTEFNDINLLDGTEGSVTFQIGIGTTAGVDTLSVNLSSARTADLGIATLDIGTTGDPSAAIDAIDGAIDSVSGLRGRLGSTQNRLQSTINTLGNQAENLTAAESRIRDVDIAYESANLTKLQILQQAAVGVLAQSNSAPQAALRLLG
ncbi:MAG: flagellin [Planctomycetota bacterium]